MRKLISVTREGGWRLICVERGEGGLTKKLNSLARKNGDGSEEKCHQEGGDRGRDWILISVERREGK